MIIYLLIFKDGRQKTNSALKRADLLLVRYSATGDCSLSMEHSLPVHHYDTCDCVWSRLKGPTTGQNMLLPWGQSAVVVCTLQPNAAQYQTCSQAHTCI